MRFFQDNRQATPPTETPPVNKPEKKLMETTKIIDTPIRSGQRIYTKGDLIITTQVSAGAEIIAEGNILVYGALRGRALAGVKGYKEARIFCHSLEAELIAIAGIYFLSESFEKYKNQPVEISLANSNLVLKNIHL